MRGVHISNFVLGASLPAPPADGTVYSVDPKTAPKADAIARALGASGPLSGSADEVHIGGMVYLPKASTFQYSAPSQPGSNALRLNGPVSSPSSAIARSGDFLVARGIFTRDEVATMSTTATRFSYPPNPPFWSVRFIRTLGGVPSDIFWSGAGASFQVQETGAIQTITVKRTPIAGSERATLIDAAAAWREVSHGHWYYASGLLNNGPIEVPSFRADHAQLCYLESGGPWLIPMWCFTDANTSDGVDYPVSLFYPALTPGSFDWVTPS
jgi:hypothetical protein